MARCQELDVECQKSTDHHISCFVCLLSPPAPRPLSWVTCIRTHAYLHNMSTSVHTTDCRICCIVSTSKSTNSSHRSHMYHNMKSRRISALSIVHARRTSDRILPVSPWSFLKTGSVHAQTRHTWLSHACAPTTAPGQFYPLDSHPDLSRWGPALTKVESLSSRPQCFKR